jgi:L-lactate dehydrogenase complex protein LldG
MNDARSHILQRLRSHPVRVSREPPYTPVRRFDWTQSERLSRFRARMESVRGEVHETSSDWPQHIFRLLCAKAGGNLLYGPGGLYGPELEHGWPEGDAPRLIPYVEPVEACRHVLFQAVDASLTSCRGAIAETGSLILWPTPEEPRLLSLVPPIHFVLLDPSQLYSTFHELLSEQAWAAGMPSNALLISGPSKSADIEQTLAYGVHGPKELVVLIRSEKCGEERTAPIER